MYLNLLNFENVFEVGRAAINLCKKENNIYYCTRMNRLLHFSIRELREFECNFPTRFDFRSSRTYLDKMSY